VQRIDPSGKHHGLHGRVIRAVENVSSDDSLLEYAHDVEAGAVLISVPAPMTNCDLAPRTSCGSTAARGCATTERPPSLSSVKHVAGTSEESS